jgi:predicted alpha/beta hydrolase family esterase
MFFGLCRFKDVAATKRVLALQDGPSILVAHSYGGAVIQIRRHKENARRFHIYRPDAIS